MDLAVAKDLVFELSKSSLAGSSDENRVLHIKLQLDFKQKRNKFKSKHTHIDPTWSKSEPIENSFNLVNSKPNCFHLQDYEMVIFILEDRRTKKQKTIL